MVGSDGMRDEFEEAGMTSCLVDSGVKEKDLLENLSTDRLALVDGVTHVLVGFDSKFSHCKGEYFVIKKSNFYLSYVLSWIHLQLYKTRCRTGSYKHGQSSACTEQIFFNS